MELKEIKKLEKGSEIFAVLIEFDDSIEVKSVKYLMERSEDNHWVQCDKRGSILINKQDLFLTEKEAYRVLIERYEDSIAKLRRNIESYEAQIIEWKKKIREKE